MSGTLTFADVADLYFEKHVRRTRSARATSQGGGTVRLGDKPIADVRTAASVGLGLRLDSLSHHFAGAVGVGSANSWRFGEPRFRHRGVASVTTAAGVTGRFQRRHIAADPGKSGSAVRHLGHSRSIVDACF